MCHMPFPPSWQEQKHKAYMNLCGRPGLETVLIKQGMLVGRPVAVKLAWQPVAARSWGSIREQFLSSQNVCVWGRGHVWNFTALPSSKDWMSQCIKEKAPMETTFFSIWEELSEVELWKWLVPLWPPSHSSVPLAWLKGNMTLVI